MYVLGHWATTRESGAFAPEALSGAGMVALMLPDIACCHDWGYACCHARAAADDAELALIQAHMLGDWYVHYGEGAERTRRGWAYRSMAPFARLYGEFFDAAEAERLRPRGLARDSVRGFAHTMAEYAIDSFIADRAPDAIDGFLSAKAALTDIKTAAVQALLSRAGADFPSDRLEANIASFTARIGASETPHQFAYRAGAKKFGLIGDGGIAFVERFLRRGAREIPGPAFETILAATARFIAAKLGARVDKAA